MTATTQHTPTPWHLGDPFNPERAVAIVAPWQDGDEEGETTIAEVCGPNDIGQIDAAFIVTACNAHDKLVAALANLLGIAEADCLDDKSNVWRSAIIDGNAALANVKGE